MRAYFFLNQYISSIQCGIQSAHCLAEMFVKYRIDTTSSVEEIAKFRLLTDWATNHKTMILLNGGYSSNLWQILNTFINGNGTFKDESEAPYPFAHFQESEEALSSVLTCVGIILPEKVYNNVDLVVAMDAERDMLKYAAIAAAVSKLELSEFDLLLCRELAKYSLAR